ncbi:hypothetical protein [Williamsoniiplasma lucivorax]|uniref:hypothetical protein n=1 Tax=Williamsoniiplasma lucivorax TaxID=209274 RepID=UPI000687D76C|nr:hypothetical protein [Williamsoniiplasma lucivorax]
MLGNYFLDQEWTKKNTKITRGKDGLNIHHLDEDKAIMLSTSAFAQENPYDWQKAERLVYCNLLEHLVLHIKIFELHMWAARTKAAKKMKVKSA